MSSGGVANIGSISAPTVQGWTLSTSGKTYRAPLVNLPFSITCSAATKVGMAMTDNNAGKIILESANDPLRFGLVNGTGGSSVGSFSFSLGNVLLDSSATVNFLSASTGSTTWSTTSAAGTPSLASWAAPGNTNAFTKVSGTTVPDAFTTISGNLVVSIALGKAIVDSATTAITPTGSGTLTLVYL